MPTYNWPRHVVLLDANGRVLANTKVEVLTLNASKFFTTDRNGEFSVSAHDADNGTVNGFALSKVEGSGYFQKYYLAPSGTLRIRAVDPKGKPLAFFDVGVPAIWKGGEFRWFTTMSTAFVKDRMPMNLDPKKLIVQLNGGHSRIVSRRVLARKNSELDIEYVLEPTS